MRVAFDLDDTLIPVGGSFATEWPSSSLLALLTRERLRAGAGGLLRELVASGHEVWIYTTSLRPAWQVRLLFRAYGVRLSGVVNGDAHAAAGRAKGEFGLPCSKYPPAFGIDVLVDDSHGMAAEGRKHGFTVIVVDPSDETWAGAVTSGLSQK